MYDVRLALTDMSQQLKACRAQDGLTLQQLATRCGVAASTIHKIESQQMVPTVSVLLKIARGLGRRPEELVRDRYRDVGEPPIEPGRSDAGGAGEGTQYDRGVGAWRIDYARGERLDLITLDPSQRAILIIERGQAELGSHRRRTRLGSGECIELHGEQFALSSEPADPVAALLIVSPAGRLAEVLGPPNAAPRPHPRPSLPASTEAAAHSGSLASS
ncbi:MAG: helix-turn-helix transcriptional regulator [Deltaproteobacteria bacterium]|nr:helix-turn-helix transcriptional regulator [Deltaproteobacteria bacterium]